jgi:tetratricopeptide (TPR) repeat protein
VVHRTDSVTVVLRLNDVSGDSVLGRASASRPGPEAAQAGLAAINLLLPKLLAPGQHMADLSALTDRRPAAVASWLEGERAYRAFDFESALSFQVRAVEQDSALAVAAIRGAQAASWLARDGEAMALAAVAVRNARLLPDRTAPFAYGLLAYLEGRPDSAVQWLSRAIQSSPGWTEAHMSLGEVYYHRLPLGVESPDSMAQNEFLMAAADSGFAPARYHLAEIAIRRGDTARAERAVRDFSRVARSESSVDQRAILGWMLACLTHGRTAIDWLAVTSLCTNTTLVIFPTPSAGLIITKGIGRTIPITCLSTAAA